MKRLLILWLLQLLVLHEKQQFTLAEPLSGENVRNAEEREFPFVVSIGRPDKNRYANEKHICTGTLISRQHVLTAAHCFSLISRIKRLQVTIGSPNLQKGRAFFSEDWITYNKWTERKNRMPDYSVNDIAIIKLSEKVDESWIVPAKLWTQKNKKLYNKKAVLAGWGVTNERSGIPNILEVADTKIISNEQCNKYKDILHPEHMLINDRHLCTNAKPNPMMECGDSGGPLIYNKNTLVGVNTGSCPKMAMLSNRISSDLIKKYRFNMHVGVAYYNEFIEDCLKNF